VCSGVCVGGLQGGWRGLENDRQYWNLWTTTVWSNGLLIRMEQEQGHREWGSDGVSRIKVLYAHVWTPPLPRCLNQSTYALTYEGQGGKQVLSRGG
jgi:hypothetical protein